MPSSLPDPAVDEVVEQPIPHEPAILNGGYGWICVLGQVLINGFTWGTAASYSIYLSFYLSHEIFPGASSLDFALIGGLNFSTAVLTAPFANLAVRSAGLRGPMLLGCVLLPAGYIAASFAKCAWHLHLSQGFLVGLGIGLIYMPATAVIPQWFSTRRSLASGIAAAGSGIGGGAMCFATQTLLDTIGLAWSLRITAAIVFFVNLAATLLMRTRDVELRTTHRMFDYGLLRDYKVILLLLWSFTIMFGYIDLMFSLPDYALIIGIPASKSATVAAVLNLGAAAGRPAIGLASDYYGRIVTTAVLTLACSILCFAMWISAITYGSLLAFAFLSGAILGIFWAAIVPLAAEVVLLKNVPSLLSLTWLAVAVPAIVAELITLQIRSPGSVRVYLGPQVFAGASYYVASLFMFELYRKMRSGEHAEICTTTGDDDTAV